ncbi:MAG: hypothetical protein WCI89_01435 [bacterium]
MNTLALSQIYINRAYALLASVCAVSVFLYAVFLLLAVTHAAGQTTALRQVQKLSVEVSDMEMRYLMATKDISPDKALALGFVAPNRSEVSVVSATAGSLSLSLR